MNETEKGCFSSGRFVRRYGPVLFLSLLGVAFGIGGWFLPTTDSVVWQALILVPCLLAGLFGFGWLIGRLRRQASRGEAGPDGLRWRYRGREQSAGWDEVRSVYRHELHVLVNGAKPSEWNRQAHVRVVLRDKSEVEFHEVLSGFDQLAHAILAHAATALLPAKAAELERTGKAKFGPLVVSGDGLSYKGRPPMPWGEINYAVSGGHLLIAPNAADFEYDEVKEIPLTDVPNYLVALHLMEQAGKPPAPPARVYPKAMRQFVGRK